jgi:predicted metallopeptidase
MPIKYYEAQAVKNLVEQIVAQLDFYHINSKNLYCFRSKGSKSKRTVARIHSLEKLWQKALNLPAGYLIEVISERFDRLGQEEKEKVIIHELLHVPRGFAGGFKPHKGNITKKKIDSLHARFIASKKQNF